MAPLSRSTALAALAVPSMALTAASVPVVATTAGNCPVALLACQAGHALVAFHRAETARDHAAEDESFTHLSAIQNEAGRTRATSLEGALFQIGLAFTSLLSFGDGEGQHLNGEQNALLDHIERCIFSAGQAMVSAGVSIPMLVKGHYLAANGSDPFRYLNGVAP